VLLFTICVIFEGLADGDFWPGVRFALQFAEVVMALGVEPKLCAHPKIAAEPVRHVRGDRSVGAQNLSDGGGAHSNVFGDPVGAQAQRDHEFFSQDLSWRNEW